MDDEIRGELHSLSIAIAKLVPTIERLERDVREMRQELKNEYVTKSEFEPVQKIVYGLVGLILVAVISAIIGIVIISPGIP